MTDLDGLIARLLGSHNESDHEKAADALEQMRAELAAKDEEIIALKARVKYIQCVRP